MPTENRSSNTEMVSVPREPTPAMLKAADAENERAILGGSHKGASAEGIYCAMIGAAPAEHYQDKPVAVTQDKQIDDIPDFTPGNGNKTERRATKLLDQLQADLTERDQRIDQLEQQLLVPQGYALVPHSMLLSKEVIGVINFHCGDTDQEEGGQFGLYTDGRLWVGYVLDDDGNKVHGLHIATDEYPEEGSTILIEFPGPDEIRGGQS